MICLCAVVGILLGDSLIGASLATVGFHGVFIVHRLARTGNPIVFFRSLSFFGHVPSLPLQIGVYL
ncbi:hypothetical protein SAMN04488112_105187 [Melghirimyces thermohalophilus]|uniref:Uncharacterized protein n=1 Tax=Melghirimyces thermohalophilus TaxID=1236220 RepID=A0A1G6KD26_9BACL|nr:hypothetical protein SAMN04488112_105187 [Melghirimyces thermohalophilus]